MKNYKIFCASVLCGLLAGPSHGFSIVPNPDADRLAAAAVPKSVILSASMAPSERVPMPTVLAPKVATPSASAFPLQNFLGEKTLPQAFHYMDGRGAEAQGKQADSKMARATPVRKDVSEPASEVLLLVALSALAIAVRRQSPS